MAISPDIVVVGIDGGGSRTRAAIVDGTGRVLGYGEAGASNIHMCGHDRARAAIAEATANASSSAGLASPHFLAAFLGVAGAGTERDREELRAIGRELELAPSEAIDADHDLRIALAGGLAGEPGIVLIAGTGSSCYGRTSDGRVWRAGGWGALLDDVGSGYWLGVQALTAVTRAVDGRGALTSLQPALVSALGIEDIEEILRMTGREGLAREQIAKLAPLVLEADADGDDVAHEIVRHGLDELARMAHAVAQNLGWLSESVRLVFTGGLSENGAYRNDFELQLGRRADNICLTEARMPPVLGAALIALEMCGAINESIIEALASSSAQN